MACLEKAPARRLYSAADLQQALARLRVERGRRGVRRTRWMTAAAAVLLLAATARFAAWRADRPVVEQITFDQGLTVEPALSANGRWMVYASDRAGDTGLEIWRQELPSGSPRRLTTSKGIERQPTVSSDGMLVAYRSESDAAIRLVDVETGNDRVLAPGGLQPRFSPEGRRLLYWIGTADSGDPWAVGQSGVYVVDLARGSSQQIAPEFSVARDPIWSPDGSSILFRGYREPNVVWERADWWMATLTGGIERVDRSIDGELVPAVWIDAGSAWGLRWMRPGEGTLVRVPLHAREDITPVATAFPGATIAAPARSQDGAIVTASVEVRTSVWFLPVDADAGRPTGALERATRSASDTTFPMLSTDGDWFAYHESAGDDSRVIWKSVRTGETQTREGESIMATALSRDGAYLVYWAPDTGSGRIRSEVMRRQAVTPSGWIWQLGQVWDVATDGAHLLRNADGAQPRAIQLVDVTTGREDTILAAPNANLHLASWSADERWLTFQANWDAIQRVFVAPYRGTAAVEPASWIEVGAGRSPRWAPGGTRVYFLAAHAGYQCLYSRRLDPASKSPSGEAEPAYHFHDAALSPLNVPPVFFASASRETRSH